MWPVLSDKNIDTVPKVACLADTYRVNSSVQNDDDDSSNNKQNHDLKLRHAKSGHHAYYALHSDAALQLTV